MRAPYKFAIAVLFGASLTACVKQSTSYVIDGKEHALTLRADQRYLWQDSVELTLIAARMPECQRKFELGEAPLDEIAVELYGAGENLYNVRAGEQRWQVDTGSCTRSELAPDGALGQPLGSFMLNEEGKMVFEPAAAP